MKTTFREEDNNFVMEFEGRLDTVASLKTAEEMEVLYNSKGHDIILDLSKLEYISSAGLRVLLAAQKTMMKQGSMVVTNPNDVISEIFEVTGFSTILTIE